MKYATCNHERQLNIEWRGHIVEGRKHIKFAKNGTEIIEYITINKNKLTKSMYALAREIYLTQDKSKHFAYVMKNYNYKTLREQIPYIDNKQILLTINQIIDELLAIDIVYWDVHSRNFLVKGKKIVVIDLDEAKLGVLPGRVLTSRYNYLDLIIHLYIGYIVDKSINYLKLFMNNITIENYFTKDTCDYMKDIYSFHGEQVSRDPSFVVDEFEDQERIEYFKSHVKELIKK